MLEALVTNKLWRDSSRKMGERRGLTTDSGRSGGGDSGGLGFQVQRFVITSLSPLVICRLFDWRRCSSIPGRGLQPSSAFLPHRTLILMLLLSVALAYAGRQKAPRMRANRITTIGPSLPSTPIPLRGGGTARGSRCPIDRTRVRDLADWRDCNPGVGAIIP